MGDGVGILVRVGVLVWGAGPEGVVSVASGTKTIRVGVAVDSQMTTGVRVWIASGVRVTGAGTTMAVGVVMGAAAAVRAGARIVANCVTG